MSLPSLPPSQAADPGSSLHIRRKVGSINLSFIGSWGSDSNETTSNLPGPGRPLGQLLSAAGRRLEAVVDRTAARAGFGFEGVARRLFVKLGANHSRCRAWSEFAKTPVVELAIELGSGHCAGCHQRYMTALSGSDSHEIEELLLRLVPSIENDQLGNRITGSMLLTALALSDDRLLVALRESQIMQRVELSLHSCKVLATQDVTWLPAWHAVHDLRQVLTSVVPVWSSLAQPYSAESIWHAIGSQVFVLRVKLRPALPLMSRVICSRVNSNIATGQDLIQQLSRDSNRVLLDALYMHVLPTCLHDNAELAGKLLGVIALRKESITPFLLATLLQLPLHDVVTVLETFVESRLITTEKPLGPMVKETAVRVCHDSLRDFLVDSRRCQAKEYRVEPAEVHELLLNRCLWLMNTYLRQDICDIRDPGIANGNISDLSTRIARSVPEVVRYACLSWPEHLVATYSISRSPSEALLAFCADHLLHWLEVLSLLGALSSALKHFPQVIAWCQSHFTSLPSTQGIPVLLRDAYYALRDYNTPIASHALQVYHSVLATGPSCKLLNHIRRGHIIAPRLVSQRASDWSPLLRVIRGHTDEVNSVACSLDGAHIVSGSDDNTVRMSNARTGEHLAILKGHRGWVLSVKFSPDGAQVASGSADGTVRVWDAWTGRQLAVSKRHSQWVSSVAFSPDGMYIVSGSRDSTVRLWDARRLGERLAVLKGHTRAVWSVAFSPDGTRIVSGSADATVRVWDTWEGKQLAVLEGHRGPVKSVTFSPIAAHVIVSGSGDKTVRVWHAQEGKQLAILEGHTDWVRSVAFSPQGTYIVSGSDDKTIRVWNARTGKELAVHTGYIGWVKSVTFSPDGVHIISGSDVTVRVWDVLRGKQLAEIEGQSQSVGCVAFSPDGTHVASGSDDHTVQLWNAQTGKQLAIFKDRKCRVLSVAFSADGQHLISRYLDGQELAWDVPDTLISGQTVQSHELDHTSPSVRRLMSLKDTAIDVSQTRNEALLWNEDTGWISWQRSHGSNPVCLCWVPVEYRGESFAWHGTTAAIGSRKGAVTILEFSDVITVLKGLNLVPSN